MQHEITLSVGTTTLLTNNALLARHTLEQETGLAPVEGIVGVLLTASEYLIPPAIGQHWEGQGGTYVGVIRGENGAPDYHLIAPKHAQIDSIVYGSAGHRIEGANHRRDGLANTRALLASGVEHPAAKWASEQQAEGHADLYLPSQAEAFLCWANIPEQFENKGWWLTSTQNGPNYAWIQYFVDGHQDGDH
ncbi:MULTISPECIES: DUF1566 domain-containing protein [unclassified Pseudomonas]|uniref:DUF1566 domain-containing protein n=1 Tax=unclassified Pseudomonas TaxID=196821 RepID=UPI002448EDB9|nr:MULTISPECIES: DUF1566 domain-containing protein [unclassified Pseudomonas]MDH0894256.1 DUF1566 domain-containing protein [Pseudomonas sp. GD03875]MDH1063449.1 DUF1566 domain-containing protein [Pseudomonas sp. GD03985]